MSITETINPPAPAVTVTKQAVQVPVNERPLPSKFNTIDGIIKSHVAEGYTSTVLAYPATGVSDFEEYTAKDLDRFIDAAVDTYIKNGVKPADPADPEAPVMAVLAPSSLEIVVTIWALNRMGYALLFLSTRLAADAYARLMELSNCDQLITSTGFDKMGADIAQIRPCQQTPLVKRDDFRDVQNPPVFSRSGANPLRESKKIGWIIHSSGSTGFPKPIFLTNFQCLANFVKKPGMRAFCVSPLFHSHALMELGGAVYLKKPMYLGNYALPVTTSNLIEAMSVAKPDLFNVVPYVLKLMAERADGIAQLRKAKLVLYAGSACPDALGDLLVENDVNLVANYGCTETGFIMSSVRPVGDKEWNYCRLHYPIAEHVLMDEISPGVFECVGLDGLPSKGPSNSDNPPNSFRTKDLFTRHPDPAKTNFYKYLSRSDDRLTLVNGEKCLPLPIEGRIRQDPLIEQAAVFGAGASAPGVLIFRSELASEMSDDDLLAAIRPSIDAANAAAETFSRIPEELIIPIPAGTVYPKTDKFTFIRAQMYQVFAKKIGAAYAAFEDTLPAEERELKALSVPELEEFLLEAFSKRLNTPLESTMADIFSAGVDSLQTARLYSIIRKELDLGSNTAKLSSNVVFEKGTVAGLARHLYGLRTGEAVDEVDEIALMQSLIDEFSVFTPHTPSNNTESTPTAHPTVLLTGATGSLGTYILSSLLAHPASPHIYALVRASDVASAQERVLSQLATHMPALNEAQLSRLTCLPADLTRPDLGLGVADHSKLRSVLTHTIHCAWPVNFTLPLHTFRPALTGLHNLIQLCLSTNSASPASFYFCSSVSVGSSTPRDKHNNASVAETQIPRLTDAQGTGYGRSKLVAERITRNAMLQYQQAGLMAQTLRIGQLAGALGHEAPNWNTTEAVPLLIRCALVDGVRCLPRLDEYVSWLPVDVCAGSIVDVAVPTTLDAQSDEVARAEPEQVHHIINPQRLHWTQDFLPALQRTAAFPEFELVETQEWLRRLRASDPDPSVNPSIKLLGFWEGKYGGPVSASASGEQERRAEERTQTTQENTGLVFETKNTVRRAPVLGSATREVMLEEGTEGYIGRLVGVWIKEWTR